MTVETTYVTRSGSRYCVRDGMIRRLNDDGKPRLADWTRYRHVNRIPLAAIRPGAPGELLEIVLDADRRLLTTPVVAATAGAADADAAVDPPASAIADEHGFVRGGSSAVEAVAGTVEPGDRTS